MYLEHFGLKEAPFKITPHTEFFFAGANRGETLEALIYTITSGEGMVKVTGEVGAGKTMLCRVLMERLPTNVETIYLAVPSLSRDEMLTVIADDLGIDTQGGNTTKLVRALQAKLIDIHAAGKRVVALIDEAHAMPLETLEQIRLLSNLETGHDKLMQIVLFGQPELDLHLQQPNMRQLKERITHSFNLLPLPARDIRDYLDFRLRAAGYKGPALFPPEVLKLIAEASEGLTRRINIYADKTLLAAYAAGTHTITPDHARAAISDTQIVVKPVTKQPGRTVAIAAASLLVGGVLGFMLGKNSPPSASPAQPQASVGTVSAAPSAAVAVIPPKPAPSDTPVSVAAPAWGNTADANWLETRIQADVARLKTMPANRYIIQLMKAEQREKIAIENYLRQLSR
ncbi:MAG: AAA family ATPase, partial [Betaproteobacteria bacterium]|nr:AAA family ATPase [Betaproteobacteria bacterium]